MNKKKKYIKKTTKIVSNISVKLNREKSIFIMLLQMPQYDLNSIMSGVLI